MLDAKTFSRELQNEFQSMFPHFFEEENDLIRQTLNAVCSIAALAIAKYDREYLQK